MKKILIGLSSLAIVSAPLLMVSCSEGIKNAKAKTIPALKPKSDLNANKLAIEEIMNSDNQQERFNEISKYFDGPIITLENTPKLGMGVEVAKENNGLNLSLTSKELLNDEIINATVELGILVQITPKSNPEPLSSNLDIKKVFGDYLYEYNINWDSAKRLEFLNKYFEGEGLTLENAKNLAINFNYEGFENSENIVKINLTGTNNIFVNDDQNSGAIQTLSKRQLLTIGAQSPKTTPTSTKIETLKKEIEDQMNISSEKKLEVANHYFRGNGLSLETIPFLNIVVQIINDQPKAGDTALKLKLTIGENGNHLTMSQHEVVAEIKWI